jgi:hypothetical protein
MFATRSGAVRAGRFGARSDVDNEFVEAPDPPPDPLEVPDAPVLSGAAGNTESLLSWTVPADDGGSAITTYELERLGSDTIAVTSHPDGTVNNATSLTFSGTATGSNRCLVVAIAHKHSSVLRTVSSVTFNGDALTSRAAASRSTAFMGSELWAMVAPDATTGNVVITLSGAADICATAVFMTGVAQTSTFGTAATENGNTADPDLVVTSSTGELVVDSFAGSTTGAVVVGSGQTERGNQASGTSGQLVRHGCSTEVGAVSVNMGWTRGADNYAVCAVPIRPADTGGATEIYAALSPRSYTDTGRVNGTTYQYRVKAVNAVGDGALSNLVSVVPQSPVEAPGAPVLSGTAGDAQVSLSWTEPNNGGATITGYRITRDGVALSPDRAASPRSFTNTGLTNQQTYTYRVRAINSAGVGALSAAVLLTPQVAVVGAPTLPPSTIVGQPTWRGVIWQEANAVFQNQTFWTTWKNRGWGGWILGMRAISGFGGGNQFIGSSAAALGSTYQYQKRLEPSGNNLGQICQNLDLEVWLGFRLNTEGQSNAVPPYGDWFNNTTWTNVLAEWENIAEFIEYCPGVVGVSLDCEYVEPGWKADGYSGDTHTAAENRAQAYLRGTQLGQVLWGACPSLKLAIYHMWHPGGWQYLTTGGTVGGVTYENFVYRDFIAGLFEGMRLEDGDGEVIIQDHYFYRIPGSAGSGTGSGTSSFGAAYKLDSQGIRSRYSTYMDQTTWNHAASRLRATGFNWLDHDGTTSYSANIPTSSTWGLMTAAARQYAEGTRRFEFGLAYQVAGWYLGNTPRYADATAITKTGEAASTALVANAAVPTFSNVAAVVASGTVTITCRAAHLYGVEHVGIYRGSTFSAANPDASYLGAATMVWQTNGGTIHTNYNNAYMDCTFTTPGNSAQWFVLGARSIKGDMAWTRVQVSGSNLTPYVLPGEVGYLGNEASLTLVNSAGTAPPGTTYASGYLTVNTNGLTLDGYKIVGGLYSEATTLTVTNCVVQGGASWFIMQMANGGTFTAEDSTFRWSTGIENPGADGSGVISSSGSFTQTLTRCDISGNGDGVKSNAGASGLTTITDCYIHGLSKIPGTTHNDGIHHNSGDMNVTGCYIDNGTPVSGTDNACIFSQTQGVAVDRVIISNTYLNGGGYQYYAENGTHSLRNVTHGAQKLFGNVQITPPATLVP